MKGMIAIVAVVIGIAAPVAQADTAKPVANCKPGSTSFLQAVRYAVQHRAPFHCPIRHR